MPRFWLLCGEDSGMRTLGIILVALGALALGWEGFTYATTESGDNASGLVSSEKSRTVWVPPVVGGIVVVTGLILLASNGRREDA